MAFSAQLNHKTIYIYGEILIITGIYGDFGGIKEHYGGAGYKL